MPRSLSARAARSPAGQGRRPSSWRAVNPARTCHARSTLRQDLEQACLDVLAHDSFAPTPIQDVAAGIGRRTVPGYVASKKDAVRGDVHESPGEPKARLLRWDGHAWLMSTIRRGVVASNTCDPVNERSHRDRMSLIVSTGHPQAHSTLRYGQGRQVVARFAAYAMGCRPELAARVIAHLALGASSAACEQWLGEVSSDLPTHLQTALSVLDQSSVLPVGQAHR
jgi:TetR/AcrR family transcriptional regulator, regulator of mycofactocin system